MTSKNKTWISTTIALLAISVSGPVFAQKMYGLPNLNFKLTETHQDEEVKLTRYQHQSSVGVELISKYKFSNWLSLAVDMNGQAYQLTPNETKVDYKDYSAKAQMGHAFSFSKNSLTPFAQIGVGYSEGKLTNDKVYNFGRTTNNTTDIQYGLGIRYSHSDWHSFGVSLIYENQSRLSDQKLPRFDTNLQPEDSIGLSVDFGF